MTGIPTTPLHRLGDPYATLNGGKPMLFSVTKPDKNEPLYPYLLALHINPSSLDEQFTKSKNTIMTVGGFVEFVWPDELDSLSASASTGAFIGPEHGLTSGAFGTGSAGVSDVKKRRESLGRHATIAWERQEDLLDLFRSNGQVYNAVGQPILRGRIQCIYDRGIFSGYFTTFEVMEDAERPYVFQLTWEFKVLDTVYYFPIRSQSSGTMTEEEWLAQEDNLPDLEKTPFDGTSVLPSTLIHPGDPAVTLGVISPAQSPIPPEISALERGPDNKPLGSERGESYVYIPGRGYVRRGTGEPLGPPPSPERGRFYGNLPPEGSVYDPATGTWVKP